MTAWDELRAALARLLEEQPGAVTGHPGLDQDEAGPPPYPVHLAPWAAAAAGELDAQFGEQVELTVGALPFPPGRPGRPDRPGRLRRAPRGEPAGRLGPREAEAGLDGPAVVRSGRWLQHRLLVTNRADGELAIATNGHLTASVVDPASGEVVGGFAGWQTAPLVTFRAAPGHTVPVPLLVGTASFTGRLGYAVPPGEWGLEATLNLTWAGGQAVLRRTEVLPLTVTG